MSKGGLDDLYVAHAPAATRLAFLLTGDRDLAQDLVHDAFIRAAGRFQHLRSAGSFGPYLRRVVVNLSRDHFRKRAVEKRSLDKARADTLDRVESHDPSDRSSVMPALAQLPYRQRVAIVLRYYEDMTENQVADAMDVSHRAARSLLSRGMATLRTLMEGDNDG